MPYPPLMLAEMAVKHVEQMGIFADDRKEDWAHLEQRGLSLEARPVQESRQAFYAMDIPEFRNDAADMNIPRVFAEADHAKSQKLGNCNEQAAVAFQYIVQEKKADGVGLFNMIDILGRRVHAFVLLGLDNLPRDLVDMKVKFVNLDQPPDYLINAVWCDPWFHEWFKIVDDWGRRARNILRVVSPTPQGLGGDFLMLSNKGFILECAAYHRSSSAH